MVVIKLFDVMFVGSIVVVNLIVESVVVVVKVFDVALFVGSVVFSFLCRFDVVKLYYI